MTKFSVLMAVYHKDSPAFLIDSLDSLRHQTRPADEVVLIEDGPITSELTEVIDRFRSALPLKSVRMQRNMGLGAALNIGLDHCSYELVARMDADDIALPVRFERQVAFMDENPSIAASSAWVEEFDESMTIKLGARHLPTSMDDILLFSRRRSPLNHPVSIFRKDSIQGVGGYPALRKAQDYALWSLLIVKGKTLANIPEVLLHMRAGAGLLERRGYFYLKQEFMLLRFQRSIGFIGRRQFFLNATLRTIARCSPLGLTKLLYRYAR